MMYEISLQLTKKVHTELVQNILPFWSKKITDPVHGGFYGQIDVNVRLIENAPKGGILNARILWTFSAAYRHLKNPNYLEVATRAKEYIINHFFDSTYGGTYWSLNAIGEPLETKKQIYSQAFFIYAFSEYYLATNDEKSRDIAINLYRLIEKYSFDSKCNGYFEAYDREWQQIDDQRLSEKDTNEKKTMNTHLHVLEAYTNLYRIWKDDSLAIQLRNLINIFMHLIIDQQSSHLNLFFDENWNCKSNITSYGHDIECSWLLYETALVLDDKYLTDKVEGVCLKIVGATLEGRQPDGSIIYELNNTISHATKERHWWPQAEAVVGFYNAYELTGDDKYMLMATESFKFIENHLIDKINGEWFWSVKDDYAVNKADDKAGFWKCPYHNGRMCLEIMKRCEPGGQIK